MRVDSTSSRTASGSVGAGLPSSGPAASSGARSSRQHRFDKLAGHLPDAQLGPRAQPAGAHDGDRVDEVPGQLDAAAHEAPQRRNVRHCGTSYAEQRAGCGVHAGADGLAEPAPPNPDGLRSVQRRSRLCPLLVRDGVPEESHAVGATMRS